MKLRTLLTFLRTRSKLASDRLSSFKPGAFQISSACDRCSGELTAVCSLLSRATKRHCRSEAGMPCGQQASTNLRTLFQSLLTPIAAVEPSVVPEFVGLIPPPPQRLHRVLTLRLGHVSSLSPSASPGFGSVASAAACRATRSVRVLGGRASHSKTVVGPKGPQQILFKLKFWSWPTWARAKLSPAAPRPRLPRLVASAGSGVP